MSIMVKSKFSNRVYNFIHRYYLAILSCVNTVCMYIQANICGVQLGRGCVFRGRASFHVSNGGGYDNRSGQHFLVKGNREQYRHQSSLHTICDSYRGKNVYITDRRQVWI